MFLSVYILNNSTLAKESACVANSVHGLSMWTYSNCKILQNYQLTTLCVNRALSPISGGYFSAQAVVEHGESGYDEETDVVVVHSKLSFTKWVRQK